MRDEPQSYPVETPEYQEKDTKKPQDSKVSLNDLRSQMKQEATKLKHTAYVCPTHEQIIKQLLSQVEKVDFRSKAGIDPTDEDAKLKKNHYLVIVVEEILDLAKRNRWGLCRKGAFFYTYNGAFWKPIDKDDLKAFLRMAAERMGVEKFTARHFEFAEQLFKQFNETGYIPAPEAIRDVIRINLTNGTFEIGAEKQYLRSPDPADFITHQLPFAYEPEAKAPLFRAFLNRVQKDVDCQKILAEFLGYIFISPSKLKLEKTLLLYGTGANGKSVFFEIVTALLGSENVSHYSLQSLTNEPAYCRALLATKLLNYASEINGKLEADTFKQMVSGEPIEARLPYGQPFILTDYAKLIFNCNELPADVEHTPAYFRRFLIVPFLVTIPEAEQDKELAAKIIKNELSGVFNWILEGLRRLLAQSGFTSSEAVLQQLEMYKKQSDTARLFMDEEGYQTDPEQFTVLKDVYRDYKTYCFDGGYKPVNLRNFQKRLNANGMFTSKKNIGLVVHARKVGTPY
jgi:putative DNA primase/helicase